MTIEVSDLETTAIVGILPEEREKPQRVVASVWIDYDYNEGGGYIDYREIAATVERLLIERRFGLLETAAATIADELAKSSRLISKIKISLKKCELPLTCVAKVWYEIKVKQVSN